MTTTLDAVSLAADIRADPVTFLRQVCGFHAWSKQREIIESVRDHPRTAVRACHGPGKTAIGGRTVLWWLAAHPNTGIAVTTAPTWTQVEQLLWREIHSAVGSAGDFFDGKLTGTQLDLGPEWFAIGLSTDTPSRFQGFHSENLLLVVDEASGVDEGIFEAGEGYLTSAESRLLLLGNPLTVSGTFHGAFHSRRALYNRISISAFDTPAYTGEEVPPEVLRRLPSKRWVEEKRVLWGEGSPLWDIKVLGQFPTLSDDSVISPGALEAARIRSVPGGYPLIVSCDVARFGSDETVIAVRRGSHARIAKTYNGVDTMETAGHVLRISREAAGASETQPIVVVDDAGVGGGVVDRLREIQRDVGGFRLVPFLGAERARDQREYPNRRSEAWFTFAAQLPSIDLDTDEQLAADLLAPKYVVDSSGRRVVEQKSETKKRLGRSPDRADAILMAFSGIEAPNAVCYSSGDDLPETPPHWQDSPSTKYLDLPSPDELREKPPNRSYSSADDEPFGLQRPGEHHFRI